MFKVDTFTLTKYKSSIRLDFRMVPGSKGISYQPSSLLYNPLNIDPEDLCKLKKVVWVNHEKQTFNTPFSLITLQEKKALLKDLFHQITSRNEDLAIDNVRFCDIELKKTVQRQRLQY